MDSTGSTFIYWLAAFCWFMAFLVVALTLVLLATMFYDWAFRHLADEWRALRANLAHRSGRRDLRIVVPTRRSQRSGPAAGMTISERKGRKR